MADDSHHHHHHHVCFPSSCSHLLANIVDEDPPADPPPSYDAATDLALSSHNPIYYNTFNAPTSTTSRPPRPPRARVEPGQDDDTIVVFVKLLMLAIFGMAAWAIWCSFHPNYDDEPWRRPH
jgi:hypothetical protein